MQRVIGIKFHNNQTLSRPALGQTLSVLYALKEDFAKGELEKILRDKTHLGTAQTFKAIPGYGCGSGLIRFEDYHLTCFGKFAYQCDASLNYPGTQWVMHYHLCAPHGPGPAFWHDLVTTRFRTGNEFTAADLTEQISSFVLKTTGKKLTWDTLRQSGSIFKGTYIKSDGLGKLGILEQVGKERYRVLAPEPPPVWATAYALLDYWQAQFGERISINLSELTTDQGFAGLFLLGDVGLGDALSVMQSEGYIEVYRSAPPYQVVLLRRDTEPLLRKLYGLE